MASLQQSPDVIALARELGVELDDTVVFDAKTPLLKVAQQLSGDSVNFGAEDAEFGGLFGRILKRVTPKKAVPKGFDLAKADIKVDIKRSATGLAKGIGTAAAVASFVVPGVGPLVGSSALAAMTAADKLLGDPRVKDAAKLVSNTKALAALGNVPARRGAAVLGAVAQIRQVKEAPMGKAVLPIRSIDTAVYVQAVPRAQVKALATNAVNKAPKRSFWQKVKELFS